MNTFVKYLAILIAVVATIFAFYTEQYIILIPAGLLFFIAVVDLSPPPPYSSIPSLADIKSRVASLKN